MTLEEKLREHILQNFQSVRAFANEHDLNYSTLDTMLKNGIRNSGFDFVSRVCNGLGIDLAELDQGRVEPDHHRPFHLISNGEQQHIEQYRALDRHGKTAVDTLLQLEHQRIIETEKPSKTLQIAARTKSGTKQQLEIRRDFDNAQLKEEDSEF